MKSLVLALGGNAISPPGKKGTIEEQFESTQESMSYVADLVSLGFDKILVTHGNGPQVGAAILRTEIASKDVYTLPMDISGADTQGGMGYMIQQVLGNCFQKKGISKKAVSLVTQVRVDEKDKAFANPTKPVGRFYTETESLELQKTRGWTMKEDAGRGFRRVVPSPIPLEVIEAQAIRTLFDANYLVVAGGGGGVPVILNDQNKLQGVEAVIDKDLTSALIANSIGAETLLILTGVDQVYIDFGKPTQKALFKISASEIKAHMEKGEFAPGSMKPKIEACLGFLARGGKRAIITSIDCCKAALAGTTGTHIEE